VSPEAAVGGHGATTRGPLRRADGVSELARANALASLWVLILTLIGCYLLSALAENVRREDCLLSGIGTCEPFNARAAAAKLDAAAAQPSKLGAYLKRSRRWR
jgi:hypothetical protein